MLGGWGWDRCLFLRDNGYDIGSIRILEKRSSIDRWNKQSNYLSLPPTTRSAEYFARQLHGVARKSKDASQGTYVNDDSKVPELP